MRSRGRRLAPAAVAALLLALAGCSTGDDAPDRPPETSAYVALGDSYGAGAGIAPITDTSCNRSGRNYASLVAARMHETSFTDVTCGSAMTRHLLYAQAGTDNGPQLDAVGRHTRLVTITMGLNDGLLSYDLLAACVSPSGTPSEQCRRFLAIPEPKLASMVLAASGRVTNALRLIRKQAPAARVILVGYPRILPDSGDCPDRFPLVPAMEPRLRATLRAIDVDWRRAAAAVGVDYIDTWTMSLGHDVCAGDPWVHGTTVTPGQGGALHPFPAFHRAVADAIVALLRKH